MNILFLRHGEDKGAVKGIFSDENLTEIGITQIKNLIPVLKKYGLEVVITSPMKRTLETTELISQELSIKYEINDKLTEFNGANLNIIRQDEYNQFIASEKGLQGYIEQDNQFDWNETYSRLIERINSFWVEFRNKYYQNYNNVLIVSHGRLLTFLISKIMDFQLDGYRFSIENGSFLHIKITQDWRPQIVFQAMNNG